MRKETLLTTCVAFIALVVAFGVLQYGDELFAPIFAGFVAGVVLTPLSNLWEKLKLPAGASAGLSVFVTLAAVVGIVLLLEPYVTKAISRLPLIRMELQEAVEDAQRLLRGLEKIQEDVSDAIEGAAGGQPDPAANVTQGAAPEVADEPAVELPTTTEALLYAPQVAAQLMIFTGVLYFFLFSRNEIYEWAGKPSRRFGKRDLERAAELVSRYFLTISAINLGLGVSVGAVMTLYGMPSPILWGLLAFMLNYILYLGPITLIATLLVTGIVVYDGWFSFMPAFTYMMMNFVEAQFVTPTLVGKNLSVNPLLVFLALVFFLWLWGPLGGIIAIPLLIWSITVYKGLAREV